MTNASALGCMETSERDVNEYNVKRKSTKQTSGALLWIYDCVSLTGYLIYQSEVSVSYIKNVSMTDTTKHVMTHGQVGNWSWKFMD